MGDRDSMGHRGYKMEQITGSEHERSQTLELVMIFFHPSAGP